ncbi:MAG: hypothetical protein MJY93_03785 [Fibrobacter sp.]|nr:hypothetical protein [Fibrobacter sp.]
MATFEEIQKLESALCAVGASPQQEKSRFEELYEKYSKSKYLDPRLDPGFKRLLKNGPAMVSFLNAILHKKTNLITLTLRPSLECILILRCRRCL